MLQLAVAVLVLAALLLGWLTVQRQWQRLFAGEADVDALAGRSCGNCGCESRCERQAEPAGKRPGEAGTDERGERS
jgi:hypothetical protein